MWIKNQSKVITNAVLALTSSALVTQVYAQQKNSKESVVYARTNIYAGRIVTAGDIAVTSIERKQVPSGAIQFKNYALGRTSLGIYCGQIVVDKRVPSGPNAGVIELGRYQPAEEIDRSAAPIKGKIGVMDVKGTWIIQPKYCEIHYTPKSKYFWVTNLQHTVPKNERDELKARLGHYIISDIWQALNSNGESVDVHLPLSTQGIEWPVSGLEFPDKGSKELLIFRAQSGIGACDDQGRTILDPRFESIDKLADGRFLCLKLDTHANSAFCKKVTSANPRDASWEIRSSKDKLLTKLPKSVSDAYDGSEDFLVCKLFSKWGVLNQSGKTVVSPLYYGLHPFSEGLAAVLSEAHHVGYVNRAGKIAITPRYSTMGDFKDGLAFTTLEKKPTRRDKQGHLSFAECKYGAIDRTGKVQLPFEYDDLRWLPNKTITALKGNCSMILDQKFRTLLKFDKNTFIYSWSEERYQAFVNGFEKKKQFLDEDGNRIGPKFEDITCFRGGHAVAALEKGHYGVIDKQGRWVVPPKYARLEFCGNDRLIAEPLTDSSSN